jgi:hypothetical protein
MGILGEVLRASIGVGPGGSELLRLSNADRGVDRRHNDGLQRVLIHGESG